MRKIHTIPEIQAIVDPIARAYGAERIFLFGSYARGEARPGIPWREIGLMRSIVARRYGTVDRAITWGRGGQ